MALDMSMSKKAVPAAADQVKEMLAAVPVLTPLVKILKMFLKVSGPGSHVQVL